MRTSDGAMPRRRVVAAGELVRSFAVAILAMAIFSPTASALSLTIGGVPDSPGDRSAFPFGAVTGQLSTAIQTAIINGDPLPTPRYQQVYDADEFGVLPMRISSITFTYDPDDQINNAALLGGTNCSGSRTECGLYTLRISTTTKDVDNLTLPSSDPPGVVPEYSPDAWARYESNLNPLVTEIFATDVLLSDIDSGGVLTFTGPNFRYDPLVDGNLIIDLQIGEYGTTLDLTQGGSTLLFDATDDAGFPSEPVPYSTADNFDGQDNSSFGLVTTFEVTTVPEPGTAVLVALGLVGIAARRRSLRQR